MHFGSLQVHQGTVYIILGIITFFLLVIIGMVGNTYKVATLPSVTKPLSPEKPSLIVVTHEAADKLINKLKEHGLWKIKASQVVPRFFIKSYPPDLNTIEDIAIRKRVFLHSLLPHALLVRQEALRKRDKLESILGKIGCSLDEINFDANLNNGSQCSWTDFLAEDEISFMKNLSKKYRASTPAGLLERVDAVPTSIILAQGALESSWGSSRFTREGNSIFGMWTWKTRGIVPLRRDEGKTHKVKAYENVLDSVRAYQLTLNRVDFYEEFRQLRRMTDDPLIMAEGLTLYSERGEEYVEDIKKVILSNDLLKYDTLNLSDSDLQELSGPVSRTSTTVEGRKASL